MAEYNSRMMNTFFAGSQIASLPKADLQNAVSGVPVVFTYEKVLAPLADNFGKVSRLKSFREDDNVSRAYDVLLECDKLVKLEISATHALDNNHKQQSDDIEPVVESSIKPR